MESEILKKLSSQGWERRFTASGRRLEEAIEDYLELGYKVRVIPTRELACQECMACFENENETSMMIFTKKIGVEHEDIMSPDGER